MTTRVRKRKHPEAGAPRSKQGNRRARLVLIAAALVGTLILVLSLTVRSSHGDWPTSLTSGSAAGYNVLLITLDTTRADRLGCYGYEGAQTPVLDSLAHAGILFQDAVTVAPITLPSHTTILTGLSPANHGVRNNGAFHLKANHTTLAEVLHGQGYQTAAFVSAFVLDSRYGLDQGFDVYGDDVGLTVAVAENAFIKPIYERPAASVTTEAINWMRNRDTSRPFFAWVHYFDPHKPYQAPTPYDVRFRHQPYDGEIAYMDAQIGRLVQVLKGEDVWDRTLVIVVADHGEGLGDHDEATHAKLIYESVMHIPLILSCPELIRESYVVNDVVVSIEDIFPTVLDVLGVDSPIKVDGRSLLVAQSDQDRVIYMENLASYLDNGWSPLYGLRRHQDKYILAPRREYYRLDTDPDELNNLYDMVGIAQQNERDQLTNDLSRRLADRPSIEVVAAGARSLDAEAVAALQALGYAGVTAEVADPDHLPDPKDMMPVMRALDRADALANGGRYEEALGVLTDAAKISPRDRRLLLSTGKVYLYMKRNKEAEQAFHACLSIRASARVCVLIAQIMLAERRLDEAEQMLDQAESLDPVYGGTYLARGDLFMWQRMIDEARESYARAAEVDPYRTAKESNRRIDRLEEILRLTSPQP